MEKIHAIALATLVLGICLSLLTSPMMCVISGMGLWILLWVAQGGMAEGNPYKRMGYSGIPDFVEVKDYKRNQEAELRDAANYRVTIFVFGIGGLLVLIGVVWIWAFGF